MSDLVLEPHALTVEKTPAIITPAAIFARTHDGSKFVLDGAMTTDIFDELLVWAGDRKASDITIQTDEFVKAVIGADLVPITNRPISAPEMDLVTSYIYGNHGPGFLKAGYDIDVAHEVRNLKDRFRARRRYRVNITGGRIPGGDGCQITIRTLPSSPIPIEQLGVEPEIVENCRPDRGMVLISGPTGSGKSTLMSSLIRHIVEQIGSNAKYIEFSSPIEYVFDDVDLPHASVWQTEVGKHLRPHASAEERKNEASLFAYAVRNALRRNPDIISIGELRDQATMQGAIEAALTGHLLYSTTHVSSVPAALARIVQFFPHDQRAGIASDLMESLRLLVTQLLYPRLGGGKVALREFMIFDEQTRAKFLKRPSEEWPAMARAMLHNGTATGRPMTESAWRAFLREEISNETYKKIMASQRDAA